MQEVNQAYGQLSGGGNAVYWDTPRWSNELRGQVTVVLLEAGIPHRWTGEELSAAVRYEARIDKILDRWTRS